MTIERSMDRLSRQDSVVKLDRVMCNMNGWSRQDSVVKLDRVMLYNMNGQSRHDSVVKLDRAMLYNMNGQYRHGSVVKLDRAMLYNMNGQSRHDSVHGDQSTCNADVDRLNDSEKSSNVYGCPQGKRLGKKVQFESPRMKLRRHCQYLGLCLFPPCYFVFLESY